MYYLELNEAEVQSVLTFIERNPHSDAAEIAFALNMPMRRVFAVLDHLEQAGEIEAVVPEDDGDITCG